MKFNPSASCVYWNVTTSWWSNRGVKTEIDMENNRVTCKTNHLTNFAVLMVRIFSCLVMGGGGGGGGGGGFNPKNRRLLQTSNLILVLSFFSVSLGCR